MKIAAIIVIVVCLLNIIQPVIGETVVPVYPIRNGQRLSILEDLAYDMSADYRDMLTYGWTPEAAEKEMIAVYMGDLLEDEELTAWCTLASEEWEHGYRPSKTVLDETIQRMERVLQSEHEGKSLSEEYRAKLEALKKQLLSDPPASIKLNIPEPILSPWKLGDCIVIQMNNEKTPHLDGQYGILRVVEIGKSKHARYSPAMDEVPWLAPLYWHGSEIPTDIPSILACGYVKYQPKPVMPETAINLLNMLLPEMQWSKDQPILKALQVILDNSDNEKAFIASIPVFSMDPSIYPLPKLQSEEKDFGGFSSCFSIKWELTNWIDEGKPYSIDMFGEEK